MRAFGGTALRAATEEEYAAALDRAPAAPGPALIDVLADPESHPAQIEALRGWAATVLRGSRVGRR